MGKIQIAYQNTNELTIAFYKLDIETVFSYTPFAKNALGYKFVSPNLVITVENEELDRSGEGKYVMPIPEALRHQNLVVEMSGNGGYDAQITADHDLEVQFAEDIGEVRVFRTDLEEKEVLSMAYIKIYARLTGTDTAVFYKDGYTDVRGRFNYRDLSTDLRGKVDRLSVLVWTQFLG